jgi:hypothetical protein
VTGIRRTAVNVVLGVTLAGIASYIVSTLLVNHLINRGYDEIQQGPSFGLFESFRMVQFLVLFRIAVCVPYTESRLTVLRRTVTGAFLFVCTTVLLTFQNLVPSKTFVPLLPTDKETAGAWWHYIYNHDGYGLGAISYTHAYVAAQIILLLGLTLHLRGSRRATGNTLLIGLALAASLVSGSRAGFAAILLVAGIFLLTKSPRWLTNFALALALFALFGFIYFSSQPPTGDGGGPISSIIQHQVNAFQPFQSENLVGRDEIWSGRIDNLNSHPWRWFTGWGLGSSPDTGPGLSPHMMPLQIIMEHGIGMLMVIGLICFRMLRSLWRREDADHPLFWTTIALFLSSATQETFYPVPSTGYFLGFYLLTLAIVFRPQSDPVEAPCRVSPATVSLGTPRPTRVGGQLIPKSGL